MNARQRSADINIQECTEGQNFDLNFQSSVLAPRQGFSLVAVAPNGEPIRGIIQLVKPDGTLSTIVQAGGTVFAWDGADGFTEVGTVSPEARLRGPVDSNFTLDAFIIITDLAKVENVKKWNGETFQDLEHNLGVDFKAKYVTVQTERAMFFNVKTGTVDTPHVILASKQRDSEVLTSTTRPAAAASAEDEWFLPTPDLRPINGVVFFAKTLLFSTERGRLYALKGLIAGADTDGLPFTSIEDFHAGSAVSGDEALINIGNDVAMGLPGRIETLSGVLEFGDAETNDASWWISPLLDGTFGVTVTSWAIAYDQTGQRVFCFPNTGDEAWVLHKSILFKPSKVAGTNDKVSPWSRWVAPGVVGGFNPTAIGNIFDPNENPRIISTSPSASNTSSSGAGTPTLLFGFAGALGPVGGIFAIKKENPPLEVGLPNWVIGGDDGILATSTNATTWTVRTSGVEGDGLAGGRIAGLAKGDNIWVGAVGTGKIIHSTDLINWSSVTLFDGDTTFEDFFDVIWWPDESKFIATSGGGAATIPGKVWTSTDGINWLETKVWGNDPTIEFTPQNICHDGSGLLFIAGFDKPASNRGAVARSTDTISWTLSTNVISSGSLFECASDMAGTPTLAVGGVEGGVGASLQHSSDAISWTEATNPGFVIGNGSLGAMAFGNDTWLAGAGNGTIATSTDGISWTLLSSTPFTGFMRDFQWSDNQEIWVGIDSTGKIGTSPDGNIWTLQASPFSGPLRSIAVSG